MNQTYTPACDRNRRRLLARVTVSILLGCGGLGFGTMTALADSPTPTQSIYTSKAIATWTLTGGGQLTIDLVANRTQTAPGPATWTRAVLVSGSQSFCDQAANQWVSRTFDVFQLVDSRAFRFSRLNSVRVDTRVTVTTSDLRFPNCAAPDTSHLIPASATIRLHISARWRGMGRLIESKQSCLPVVCYTVNRFRFATVTGSMAADTPELSLSLASPTIAGLSTFTMVQHPPAPPDEVDNDNQGESLDNQAGSNESGGSENS